MKNVKNEKSPQPIAGMLDAHLEVERSASDSEREKVDGACRAGTREEAVRAEVAPKPVFDHRPGARGMEEHHAHGPHNRAPLSSHGAGSVSPKGHRHGAAKTDDYRVMLALSALCALSALLGYFADRAGAAPWLAMSAFAV